MLRPLNKGEFGISFLNTRDRQILPEEGWELVDRNLQAGDIVKRSFESVESGTIVGSKVHVLLSHAITGVSKTSWVDTDELKPNVGIFHGDYVVCDDWVGIVEEVMTCLA